jgi:hypothetical protein
VVFYLATIKFKDDRQMFSRKVREDCVHSCSSSPEVSERDVMEAQTIVGQMGAEPFLVALKNPAVDIIVTGRSYDPAPFAAFSITRGVEASPAWHMGKIMECGGLCASPKGRSMVATMYRDSFELTPPASVERCTPLSVAAHTLYEKSRPDRLPGPGGVLHVDNATYQQQSDGRSVLVTGSEFVANPKYQVKLEGVKQIGFRTVFIGGVKDPILINGLDTFLQTVRDATKQAFPALGTHEGYGLLFHVYGQDAVMGQSEPSAPPPREVGIMGEVLAPSQEEADSIAGFARITVLHASYKNQVATGGNLASPVTPLEQPAGPVFEFTIYNLVDVDSPLDLYTIDILSVGTPGPEPISQVWPNYTPQVWKDSPALPSPNPPIPSVRRCFIRDLASVVRSKNSGPFEITLDILFARAEIFQRVRDSNVLDRMAIKQLYYLEDEDIVTLMYYEPALAWKCTFKREWPQGSFGERDTFGCQQHVPLLSIEVPAIGVTEQE